ncbi:MAG: DUF2855 family protein [Halioglobus sp.]
MTQCSELWVDRTNLRVSKKVVTALPELSAGEVLVAIYQFGLTANNVSYAVAGDAIGYWSFYPAEGNWGRVPVWGCAEVIASRCESLPLGDRLWGFFPMASHTTLQPGKVRDEQFMDVSEHRKPLPALYNAYRRTRAEPAFMQQMEVERCLLFPLFATSYMLYDYLLANNFFGAEQILIGSVSSKTGYGLAKLLHNDKNVSQRIVGLTSATNVAFVNDLNCCDDVVVYEHEADIDASLRAAYIDMSGDARLTVALHNHLGSNMVESTMVGATHWEEQGTTGELPGAKPTFFFAPGHIAKREAQWGSGVIMMKAMVASAEIAQEIKGELNVEWIRDLPSLAGSWNELLDNKVSPSRGLMVSLL